MPARWRCKRCKIEFNGDGASRHYLAYPGHKLEKLPPVPKAANSVSEA
ncbi:MAG: hypothetical protein ACREAS_02580 [Nitrososphaera sp.]